VCALCCGIMRMCMCVSQVYVYACVRCVAFARVCKHTMSDCVRVCVSDVRARVVYIAHVCACKQTK
jgi:hypothetical protein